MHCVIGHGRGLFPVDILRRGCAENSRVRFAATPGCISPQSVEHYGLLRCRHGVSSFISFPLSMIMTLWRGYS